MVKEKLNGEFEIKDLGLIKRVFGIDVIRNRDKSELFLSKTSYLKKVVEYFRMSNSKGWHSLGYHTKLSIKQCTQSEHEKMIMEDIPCTSWVGSIMYGLSLCG